MAVEPLKRPRQLQPTAHYIHPGEPHAGDPDGDAAGANDLIASHAKKTRREQSAGSLISGIPLCGAFGNDASHLRPHRHTKQQPLHKMATIDPAGGSVISFLAFAGASSN